MSGGLVHHAVRRDFVKHALIHLGNLAGGFAAVELSGLVPVFHAFAGALGVVEGQRHVDGDVAAGALFHLQADEVDLEQVVLLQVGVNLVDVAVHDQLFIGDAAGGTLAGVGNFGQEGDGGGEVAKLAVREAVQRDGRDLDALADAVIHLQLHAHLGGQVDALLVRADGVDQGLLRRSLVVVDDHVGVLLPAHAVERVGDLLRQQSVRIAGVGAVKVADLVSSQVLARGEVQVHIGIGELIDGVGAAVAVAEVTHAALGGLDVEVRHMTKAGLAGGETGVVAVGHDDDLALGDDGVLDEHDSRQQSSGLGGVRAAHDHEGRAGLAAVKDVDFGVAVGALEERVVIRQHLRAGDAGALEDGLDVELIAEFLADREDPRAKQRGKDQAGKEIAAALLFDSFVFRHRFSSPLAHQ